MSDIAERVSLDWDCQECGYHPSLGDFIVNRARLERLLEFGQVYWDELYGPKQGAGLDVDQTIEKRKRALAALHAMQPGDLDPLP